MIRDLARASDRIYLSTTSLSRHFVRPARWLPVPSNIPFADDPGAVAAIRRGWPRGGSDRGPLRHLRRDHPAADPRPGRRAAGEAGTSPAPDRPGRRDHARGAARLPPRFGRPRVRDREALEAERVSWHIQACDVMAQCYDDGVSGRRGTLMACLAHGRPTATNLGRYSGPFWAESRGVAAIPHYDPAAVARQAAALLDDPAERAALSAGACALYDGHSPWNGPSRSWSAMRRRSPPGHDRPSRGGTRRPPRTWVLVSGDFTPLGGMDRANHGLATYLAGAGRRGPPGHAPRRGPTWRPCPTVRVHRGAPPLGQAPPGRAAAGPRRAPRGAADGVRRGAGGGQRRQLPRAATSTGSTTSTPPGPPRPPAAPLRRLKAAVTRRAERGRRAGAASAGPALVIANSERTRRDLIERLGIDPEPGPRRSIYGVDPERFRPPTGAERAEARDADGLGRRPPGGGVRRGDGRPPQGVRHAVRGLAAAGRRARRGTRGWWSSGAGASLPAWRARAEAEGLSGSIAVPGLPPRRAGGPGRAATRWSARPATRPTA